MFKASLSLELTPMWGPRSASRQDTLNARATGKLLVVWNDRMVSQSKWRLQPWYTALGFSCVVIAVMFGTISQLPILSFAFGRSNLANPSYSVNSYRLFAISMLVSLFLAALAAVVTAILALRQGTNALNGPLFFATVPIAAVALVLVASPDVHYLLVVFASIVGVIVAVPVIGSQMSRRDRVQLHLVFLVLISMVFMLLEALDGRLDKMLSAGIFSLILGSCLCLGTLLAYPLTSTSWSRSPAELYLALVVLLLSIGFNLYLNGAVWERCYDSHDGLILAVCPIDLS